MLSKKEAFPKMNFPHVQLGSLTGAYLKKMIFCSAGRECLAFADLSLDIHRFPGPLHHSHEYVPQFFTQTFRNISRYSSLQVVVIISITPVS